MDWLQSMQIQIPDARLMALAKIANNSLPDTIPRGQAQDYS